MWNEGPAQGRGCSQTWTAVSTIEVSSAGLSATPSDEVSAGVEGAAERPTDETSMVETAVQVWLHPLPCAGPSFHTHTYKYFSNLLQGGCVSPALINLGVTLLQSLYDNRLDNMPKLPELLCI